MLLLSNTWGEEFHVGLFIQAIWLNFKQKLNHGRARGLTLKLRSGVSGYTWTCCLVHSAYGQQGFRLAQLGVWVWELKGKKDCVRSPDSTDGFSSFLLEALMDIASENKPNGYWTLPCFVNLQIQQTLQDGLYAK